MGLLSFLMMKKFDKKLIRLTIETWEPVKGGSISEEEAIINNSVIDEIDNENERINHVGEDFLINKIKNINNNNSLMNKINRIESK